VRQETVPHDDQRGRAAQYVRMSTDHQKYSTQNQEDAIAEYAALHTLTIVRTYVDGLKALSLLTHMLGRFFTCFCLSLCETRL
jgi:hypothetical protein